MHGPHTTLNRFSRSTHPPPWCCTVQAGNEIMTRTVTDVICLVCGTHSDDLEVMVSDDGKTIVDIYNACAIGAEKVMGPKPPAGSNE